MVIGWFEKFAGGSPLDPCICTCNKCVARIRRDLAFIEVERSLWNDLLSVVNPGLDCECGGKLHRTERPGGALMICDRCGR